MIVQNLQDPLSDVLSAIDARALFSVRFAAGGSWSVAFPPPGYLKFNAIREGGTWLIPQGEAPLRIEAGDCLVVSGKAFTLCSDLNMKQIAAAEVFAGGNLDVSVGDGRDFVLLGGSVNLDTVDGSLLTDALPPIVVVDREEAGPIGWLLEQLDLEWNSTAPGARIACNDLLRLVFIHVLRAYMARQTSQHPGWLAGLADARLAPALRAIHADPSHRWTVEALASLAGQSRSGFAERFRAIVGASPIDYLAGWRMRLAAARLRRGNEPLPKIAQSLGYASDSAFAASFRRTLGQSPARYRALHRDDKQRELVNA
ncbi:AraC family transcriptional regulator [Shinella sedimenti]|uniref:AraC family transcriptional regulator n=1 Tax=Shinella sedimenti TaxID=2919913 RepID=A0ABT0CTJ8_9HYPH|nr:AraC family transcriptional regulator [Shinella sedimenti]MCJ8151704.1 AraC family transcriptional regulator [Shinella sedimenti]